MEAARSDIVENMDDSITPNLNKLIREGLYFPNTITSATFTKPSLASILTSTIPPKHKVINDFSSFNKCKTFVEILSENNVNTVGFSGLRSLGPVTNFNRGFSSFFGSRWHDKFYNSLLFKVLRNTSKNLYKKIFPRSVSGSKINKRLSNFLKNNLSNSENNFFLIFYFELHATLRSLKSNKLAENEIESFRKEYEMVFKNQDKFIGEVLSIIEDNNMSDKTSLFITSDHGEALGLRDGFSGHGSNVYEELIRVPLIIHSPKIVKPKTIKNQVRTIDIAPTICDLFGIKDLPDFEGQSLINEMGDFSNIEQSYALTFCNPNKSTLISRTRQLTTFSVRKYPWKLISNHDVSFELYNLEEDPLEEFNVFEQKKSKHFVKEMVEISSSIRHKLS